MNYQELLAEVLRAHRKVCGMKVYRYEHKFVKEAWREFREIPNNMSEFETRGSFFDWMAEPYMAGETFKSVIHYYENSPDWEAVSVEFTKNDGSNLWLPELPVGNREPKKCNCDIKVLMQQGCTCKGI